MPACRPRALLLAACAAAAAGALAPASAAAASAAAAAARANAPASCSQAPYCDAAPACTKPGASEADGFELLDDHAELLGNIGRAVDIARSFPGVISDDALDIHVSFMYLCCMTVDDLRTKVYPALDAVKWAPFNISFSRAICNRDGSIILALDDASQATMGAVVARFEAAIVAAGVPVFPRSKMQGFHMTIAATNDSFPMEVALDEINAAVPAGTWAAPFALSKFAFLLPWPHQVRANLPAAAAAAAGAAAAAPAAAAPNLPMAPGAAAGAAAAAPQPLMLPLKIVQFADLHFGEAEALDWGPAQDANSSRVMRAVLAAEGGAAGVGLAVFSGDQITGNNVAANATAYSRIIYAEAAAAGVNFASIFGNHDDAPLESFALNSTTTRRALLAFERATWPALSRTCGAAGDAGCPPALAPAVSNYYLLVRDAAAMPRAVLYFLDSGGGSYAETLAPAVTSWLAATAAALAAAHGALPSLTFVHIPPPEYAAAAGGAGCVGLADDGVTPTVGANNLAAVLAATGAARAVSVGHDHGNAWCCPRAGLALCFGRHTGYGGYGDWARGARVFELTENATAPGGVSLRTWIRMENGTPNSEELLDAPR